MSSNEEISYIVGEEKRLQDLVGKAEVMPLLASAVEAGAAGAALRDSDGRPLWSCGCGEPADYCLASFPVFVEGETVGSLTITGAGESKELIAGFARLLGAAVNTVVANNLKRMLTAEIHTSVVTRSYEELLDANRKLTASEARYRELSENLEKLVEERTGELERAHARLLQQEKMVSIGQLAAGVAHEINNPLGFIMSNLGTLKKYTDRFLVMLDHYRCLMESGAPLDAVSRQADEKWRELRLQAVCSDVDGLLTQSLEGAERVRKIIADLKAFSHVDDAAGAVVDLNGEIDRTLNVLQHELPPGTVVERQYGALPSYSCNGALLCQVFFNILQNALQARSEGLRLQLGTGFDGTAIRIRIGDNGPGIPAELRKRIFEPFFTTKEVGTGTGMGLAVAYDIVAGFGGSIVLEDPADSGATFSITLPLKRT